MKIYKHEHDLKNVILSNRISYYTTQYSISEPKLDLFKSSLDKIRKQCPDISDAVALAATGQHPDLLFISAILVSTVMNRNDDIFLPSETWPARASIINTPFNDDHQNGRREDEKPAKIIGHNYGSRVLDEDGKVIDAESTDEYFDIEVDSVVYSTLYPNIAKDIIAKGPTGEKCVSMEACMGDFAYGILDGDDLKIVERNEETSFLTKYLRAYGGDGTYNDQRIGRVLKDFYFIGMGHVDVPANEKSLYTSLNGEKIQEISKTEFLSCINSLNSRNKVYFYTDARLETTRGEHMAVKTFDKVEDAVAEINKLEEQIATLRAAESQKAVDKMKSEIQDLTAKIKSLEDTATVNQEKIVATEQAKTDAETKAAELQTKLDELEKTLAEKTEKLDAIESAKRGVDRVDELVKLGYKIDDKAKAAEKYALMSDDTYNSVKEAITSALKSVKPVEKKDPAVAADEELETATEDKETDVANASADSEDNENTVEAIGTVLAKALSASRKAPVITKGHRQEKNSK